MEQGDTLSPLFFSFALQYAMWRVQVIQDGLKLNGTHDLWFMLMMLTYWAEEKNTDALLATEVNNNKIKYMDISRDQSAGRSHSIKNDNSSFKGVEHFKYLGTTLPDQNSIPGRTMSRLNLENVCCLSMQNPVPSNLLSKN